MDYKEIGLNIKKYRKGKMTQKQLANAINRTESSIRKYEKGLVEIPIKTLGNIADCLDIELQDLLPEGTWKQIPQTPEESEVTRQTLEIEGYGTIYEMKTEDEILLDYFNQLNATGQNKALEYTNMLTKIPEFIKTDDSEE